MRGRLVRKISLHVVLIVLFFSSTTAYPSAGQAPDRSNESDQDWSLVDGPTAPGGVVDDLVEAPQSPDTLFALFQGRAGERLFRSMDASLTWQQVYTFTAQVDHLSVTPAISTTLFAGGQDGAFRSIDGGLSWTHVYTLGEALAVAVNDVVFATGKVSAGNSCNTYAVSRSSNNGDDWQTSLLDCIGGITQLVIDPTDSETIYAAGYITETLPRFGIPVPNTRIWRSLDGGQTFKTLLNDAVPHYGEPTSLVVDPQTPQRLYLSISGIMISDDYGDSWQTVSDVPPYSFKMIINAESLYAIQTDIQDEAHVYRSQDQGHTWWTAARSLPNQVNAIAANPDYPDRVYVGMGGYGIFRSDTQGGDWQEHNIGIQSPAGISCLAVAQSDPKTIYAGSYRPRGGLFDSHDGGLTWQYILTDTKVFAVAVSPSDPELVFAADSNGLLRSEHGQGWTRIYMGDLVFSISLPPSGSEGLYIAGSLTYGPGAYVARFLGQINGAWSWRVSSPIGDAFQIQKVLLDPVHPGRVYVGAMTYDHGGAVYKLENDQSPWQTVLENADAEVIDLLIDPRQPGSIFAATYDGMYVSQDEGKTWVLRDAGFPTNSAANHLAMDELGTLYTGTYSTGVYRWDSSQARWIQDGLTGQRVYALAFWPGSPPALLAGNAAGLWKRLLPIVQKIWMPVIISQN